MNAIDYMIGFEQDGLHLYELLAFDCKNDELKTTFNLLADSQRRHLTELLEMKGVIGDKSESTLVGRAECMTNGFRRLLESHDIHRELKNDPDAVWHILHAEEEYIHLLEGMAKAEKIDEVRDLLERMVEDEREHRDRIVNIYEFIKAPHTYLEWGEFSNLHSL